jgi:hypothetical protein
MDGIGRQQGKIRLGFVPAGRVAHTAEFNSISESLTGLHRYQLRVWKALDGAKVVF